MYQQHKAIGLNIWSILSCTFTKLHYKIMYVYDKFTLIKGEINFSYAYYRIIFGFTAYNMKITIA